MHYQDREYFLVVLERPRAFGHPFAKLSGVVGERARGGYGAQLGENLGIERVGFRESTEGSGEVAHLARISHDDGQACFREGRHGGAFEAAGGFEDDQLPGMVIDLAQLCVMRGRLPGNCAGSRRSTAVAPRLRLACVTV